MGVSTKHFKELYDELEQVKINTSNIQTYTRTPTGLWAKQVTVGTSAIGLGADSSRVVILKADSQNTGNIFVGGSGVSPSTGYKLEPGEYVPIEIDSLSKIFVVADTDGQKLYVLWVR